jgi:asparagine synthase (glutamine-hydrolysing)
MCGIAGIVNLGNTKSDLVPHITSMTARMRPRGPDDEGYLLVDAAQRRVWAYGGDDTPRQPDGLPHIRQAAGLNVHIAFGHRRLRILDLSFRGHQPMADASSRFWIIFNGEIYNFKEIRSQLQTQGHHFASETDTEVVLHAFMEWGIDCLDRFNGMFALALYDHSRRQIWLARDRLGIKPLYYIHQGDLFIFASDIKTILSSGLYRPRVHAEGLWHNLSFSVAPRPMTMFEDVVALEPAHWLRIDIPERRLEKRRYWRLPIHSQDTAMTEAEAVELLDRELTRSIHCRLNADVPVGVFMSGGIDSTTVAAIAAGIQPGINAFTLAYDRSVSQYDELQEAKDTAALHPLSHIVETVDARQVQEGIDHMVLDLEEPYCSLAPNYLISRLAAGRGMVVVLNGLGGDELFAGYSHYVDLPRWRRRTRLAALWLRLLPFVRLAPNVILRYRDLKSVEHYYAYQFSNFNEYQKRRLFADDGGFNSLEVLGELYRPDGAFTDEIEALGYYDLMAYIGNHHVYRIDQFTMHFSLEGRFPFLDHRLIEAAFRIPSGLKLNNKVGKYVLRRLAERYIAPSCLRMKKKGFGLPVGRWLNRELKDLTLQSLNNLKKRGMFKEAEIDRIYQTYRETDYKKVWHLVMTELWLQKFIDGGTKFYAPRY